MFMVFGTTCMESQAKSVYLGTDRVTTCIPDSAEACAFVVQSRSRAPLLRASYCLVWRQKPSGAVGYPPRMLNTGGP